MKILVTNWTNWRGYHVVNKLLAENYRVDGLINDHEEKFNHFAAYFARNSLFSFVEYEDLRDYSDIVILSRSRLKYISSARKWHINCKLPSNGRECIFVSTPILYGEWMPMNEQGIYFANEWIDFSSKRFKTDTLYIGDFMQVFIQWLNATLIPRRIELGIDNQHVKNQAITLENMIFFRDNRPKYKQTHHLKEHYKKHKLFYENQK